ncbi:putative permease of the major facilitator superfamily protein [Croceivirga lutea]|uniref:MFS transporter n=1 Tax=Croceivirga lutea TaxID=1775167 RepID=UPI00163955FD|nr:MFS transporter [Croceivirga lutea]GGG46145.1 putative permease of the major facilitator superfamily protein [Croceivirga lutea]
MKSRKALLALALGGFGIGLTEFVIMGILPEVANGLQITIPKAGHFIAAYALGVVVGAPLLATIGNKLPSKKMLLLLMIWFTVFNTLSAFSSNYIGMLTMRFLSGLPHGAFFGIGSIVATQLAKEGKAAQAIATMFSGLTVANVIGVPLGTYLGQTYDWSISFFLVGVVGIFTLLSIFFWMPKISNNQVIKESKKKPVAVPVFKNGELWALIALTAIGTGGFFAWYSYIAPLITDVAKLPDYVVSYAMIIAGVGMVLGNFIGARMAEVFKPLKSVIISLSAMSGILVVNSFLAFNPVAVLMLSFAIGLITFTVAAPLQMAIINSAQGAEKIGASMNQSAFNIGNASGAYAAGLPLVFGYSVTSASVVGAALATFGVLIAAGILLYRKQKLKMQLKKTELAIDGK